MIEVCDTYEYIGMKVSQPLGDFYIGKISATELYGMSRAEVRDMKENDINQRIGIQRELNLNRVKEISEYVKTGDASFPNSIILSVKAKNIKQVTEISRDNNIFKIVLKKNDETFQIIDGQHRISGFENYDNNCTFDLNVSLFLEMDPEQQGILFATINSKQKPVDKNLLMDLHTMQHTRNPIKSAHYISRLLNSIDSGPLYNRVTPFYENFKTKYKYTQANFIQKLVKYISGNDKQLVIDRDLLKKGKPLMYGDESIREKLIFRNLFIDENDVVIAKIINNYFGAVEKCWPQAWKYEMENYVLARTIGFNSLFAVMPIVFKKINKYDKLIETDEFYNIFKKLLLNDNDFKDDNPELSLNGSGQRALTNLFKSRLEKV